MKQGQRKLEDFIDDCDETMVNAGGVDWDDRQKISRLETAISTQLLKNMIGRDIPESYEEYRNLLRRVNYDWQRVNRITQFRTNRYTEAMPGPSRAQPDPDAMDTSIGAIRRGQPTKPLARPRTNDNTKDGGRARWVLTTTMQRRRDEGACLRCGEQGHIIRDCHLLPPRRPRTTVASTAPVRDEGEEPTDEVMFTDEESEKE
jgi:hypothetical protein